MAFYTAQNGTMSQTQLFSWSRCYMTTLFYETLRMVRLANDSLRSRGEEAETRRDDMVAAMVIPYILGEH